MSKAKKAVKSTATVTDKGSLINVTLERMATKANKNGTIARLIQETDHDSPLVRMGKTFQRLQNERKSNAIRERGTGVPTEMKVKPEALVSFTQQLINMVSWTAYALTESLKQADDWDNNLGGGTGTDCYAELCTQFGISPVRPEWINEIVANDFESIQAFYSKLKTKTSYLPSHDDIHLYHDTMPDPDGALGDPWVTREIATNFDEAYSIMLRIIDESEAQTDANDTEDWESLASVA